jgi:hypothetical protein
LVTRLLTSLAAAVVLAVGLLAVSGAAAARSCGGGVTVKGAVACSKAKRIVGEFKRTRERHIQGYRCSGAVYGGQVTEVTCRLQLKRIRWRA